MPAWHLVPQVKLTWPGTLKVARGSFRVGWNKGGLVDANLVTSPVPPVGFAFAGVLGEPCGGGACSRVGVAHSVAGNRGKVVEGCARIEVLFPNGLGAPVGLHEAPCLMLPFR